MNNVFPLFSFPLQTTALASIFDTPLGCQYRGGCWGRVGAGGVAGAGAGMYLLIGHAWSIHTTGAATEAPNPIPVSRDKTSNCCSVGGLIYSVIEAANCDMALLRTVAPPMQ
jgi:hypothetical protein